VQIGDAGSIRKLNRVRKDQVPETSFHFSRKVAGVVERLLTAFHADQTDRKRSERQRGLR